MTCLAWNLVVSFALQVILLGKNLAGIVVFVCRLGGYPVWLLLLVNRL